MQVAFALDEPRANELLEFLGDAVATRRIRGLERAPFETFALTEWRKKLYRAYETALNGRENKSRMQLGYGMLIECLRLVVVPPGGDTSDGLPVVTALVAEEPFLTDHVLFFCVNALSLYQYLHGKCSNDTGHKAKPIGPSRDDIRKAFGSNLGRVSHVKICDVESKHGYGIVLRIGIEGVPFGAVNVFANVRAALGELADAYCPVLPNRRRESAPPSTSAELAADSGTPPRAGRLGRSGKKSRHAGADATSESKRPAKSDKKRKRRTVMKVILEETVQDTTTTAQLRADLNYNNLAVVHPVTGQEPAEEFVPSMQLVPPSEADSASSALRERKRAKTEHDRRVAERSVEDARSRRVLGAHRENAHLLSSDVFAGRVLDSSNGGDTDTPLPSPARGATAFAADTGSNSADERERFAIACLS